MPVEGKVEPTVARTIHYGVVNHPPRTHGETLAWLANSIYSLAMIMDEDTKDALAKLIDNKYDMAWIGGWRGNTYYPDFPVLHSNGNITVVPHTDPDVKELSCVLQWAGE